MMSYTRRKTSNDGSRKYIFDLEGNLQMEAAFFTVEGRQRPHIACVSTQVGCAVGCPFCATSQSGFFRNLTMEEILLQIATIILDNSDVDLFGEGFEVSFMGMGETLANLQNVLTVVKELHARYPLISRVSVSTAGPAKRIDALTKAMPLSPRIHLQISLHATRDTIRKQLIPYAPDTICNLLDAGQRYHEKTGDQVCLNYILLKGVNDSVEDAQWLAQLDPQAFYVKLTALNPLPEMPAWLVATTIKEIFAFAQMLELQGMPYKVFVGDGLDVQASCGQLAALPHEVSAFGRCPSP